MPSLRFLVLALLGVVCATSSVAQKESLLIGPGDLLQVDVLDTPEMTQQVRVSDAGTVTLAYIGAVHVANDTPSEAGIAIQKALIAKQIMKQPQVTIRVQEYATQDVSVLGQVKNPGTYSVTTAQPVLKLLSLAGGLTDMADRQITIKRHSDSQTVSYYVSNDSAKALAEVPMVYPGDIVMVPKVALVYVMGDVSRPGGYPIATNDSRLTVLQAIAMAGSANKTAIRKIRLIRTTDTGRTEIPLQLAAIEKGKQPDLPMQPNDILYVPFSWMKNVAMTSSSIVSSTAGSAIYVLH